MTASCIGFSRQNKLKQYAALSKTDREYPIAQGPYAGIFYDQPTDISWYKNNKDATSHFAAPSKYDSSAPYSSGTKRAASI